MYCVLLLLESRLTVFLLLGREDLLNDLLVEEKLVDFEPDVLLVYHLSRIFLCKLSGVEVGVSVFGGRIWSLLLLVVLHHVRVEVFVFR